MKNKILRIINKVKKGQISSQEATMKLLDLFAVSGSLPLLPDKYKLYDEYYNAELKIRRTRKQAKWNADRFLDGLIQMEIELRKRQ